MLKYFIEAWLSHHLFKHVKSVRKRIMIYENLLWGFSFTGSAGQSFACFLTPGMNIRLVGEANDYVGKVYNDI